jgi:hypothetical protein
VLALLVPRRLPDVPELVDLRGSVPEQLHPAPPDLEPVDGDPARVTGDEEDVQAQVA